MYPRDGMAALPGAAKLSFESVAQASSYRVQLVGDEGTVLKLRTTSNEIAIPNGTLKAGRHYSWLVEANGPEGQLIGRGSATFVTISEEDQERRAALSKAVQVAADQAAGLSLIADVDFRLGLLEEAREGFTAALRLKPDGMAISRQLGLVEDELAGKPER